MPASIQRQVAGAAEGVCKERERVTLTGGVQGAQQIRLSPWSQSPVVPFRAPGGGVRLDPPSRRTCQDQDPAGGAGLRIHTAQLPLTSLAPVP
ncbi:unnamed protein product [Arctogadus glacialis]